jgi:phosphatidylserine decarboxylase
MSKRLIKKFVKNNNIDLNDYESDNFKCFNDCFCRRIKEGLRPIDQSPKSFISPCDALLSAYKVTPDTLLGVKGSLYRIEDLVNDAELAKSYADGICLVFRLCVHHYHRYIYLDNGSKGENVFIKGRLHTVRPIALEATPVFKQNCREYTVMDTENLGKATQIEVGAMLVGKIKNHHGVHTFKRGEEKGTFLYGGSTVILLLEKDSVSLSEDILKLMDCGEEIEVKMGQLLGKALKTKITV